MKAGKYDIVKSNNCGQLAVVESVDLEGHVAGATYQVVFLNDSRCGRLFARDFEVVKRDARNEHLDWGTSELARKTTHVVACVNAK